MTINPPIELPAQTKVNVLIEAGTFQDLADNSFAGINDPQQWTFTTLDEKAPDIISFTPKKGTPDVAVNTSLEITFSEAVQKGQGLILFSYGNKANAESIAVTDARITIENNKVIIRHGLLPAGTLISIGIQPGAFTDKAGNLHKGITDNNTWNFITAPPADDTPPQLQPTHLLLDKIIQPLLQTWCLLLVNQ